jgi:hypothetical protein
LILERQRNLPFNLEVINEATDKEHGTDDEIVASPINLYSPKVNSKFLITTADEALQTSF